jgi:hypothetical protein
MAKKSSRVDRRRGGKERLVRPANEPENNTMEQQTGRPRTTLPRGVSASAGGRRRTRGGKR